MCTPLCTERLRIKSKLRDCKYPQGARGPRSRSRWQKHPDDRHFDSSSNMFGLSFAGSARSRSLSAHRVLRFSFAVRS